MTRGRCSGDALGELSSTPLFATARKIVTGDLAESTAASKQSQLAGKRRPLMRGLRWLPGTSGNPDGRRAESDMKLVRELAREHTAEAVNALREIMLDPRAQAMARARAAETRPRAWVGAAHRVHVPNGRDGGAARARSRRCRMGAAAAQLK